MSRHQRGRISHQILHAPVAAGVPVTLKAMPPPYAILIGLDLSTPGWPLEQTPVGGPHAEVGLKPQLSTRGHETKEKKMKSLLTAVQTMNLHTHDQLRKNSVPTKHLNG